MIGLHPGDVLAVAALLGAALAAAAALRRRSAAERHWLLTAGVAAALAVPAVRAALPDQVSAAVGLGVLTPGRVTPPPGPVVASQTIQPVTTTVAVSRLAPSRGAGFAAVLPWLCLAGAGFASARLGVALLRLRSIGRRAEPLDSGPWRTAADEVGSATGLRRHVRLLLTDHGSLLATCGWRRPVILLPREALTWEPERVRIVLAHEMAHIARGDWGLQLAGEALRALHWFNPLVWLVCRRLRLESERASDDAVLALGIRAPAFAGHLVALARRLRPTASPWLPAPAMVRQSSLEGRIRAMLDPTIVRRPASFGARSLMATGAFALLLPLTALTSAAQFHALRGHVVDPTGRVLPNVAVVLISATTGARYEIRSDAAGRFELVGLPPATYSLEASALGFRAHTESLPLSGDIERQLQLAVGTLQETITVVDDGGPDPAPDAAATARREERRARAGERQQRALATCAAGPPIAVGGNILPPMKVLDVRPQYPEHLRPAGVAGTVTMKATIDVEGRVRDVSDVVASHPDLESPAVEAVRGWEFTTTLLNCQPIEVEMTVTVKFSTTL